MSNRITTADKNGIIAKHKLGFYTQREIADDIGVSKDTVYRVLKAAGLTKSKPTSVTITGSVTVTAPAAVKVEAPFIWNANSKFISITQGRETWNADKDHPAFAAALALLASTANMSTEDEQVAVAQARDLINIERAVKNFVKGDVKIQDGGLFYQGIELRSGLVDRIIDSMNKGEDFEFYLPFLENLLENPSPKAVQRLFDFLVANDIEITEDGHFIGWKIVRENYFDCHSGTFDNSPGKVVKMPRSRVNDDDTQTCSAGLHVCSKGYIGHFGGRNSKVVSVKVHPRDVVSIPVDYNDAKMRACQYEVLADVTERFKNDL